MDEHTILTSAAADRGFEGAWYVPRVKRVLLTGATGLVGGALGVATILWTRGYDGSGCSVGSVGLGGSAVIEVDLVA